MIEYNNVHISPDYDRWQEILKKNASLKDGYKNNLSLKTIENIREELLKKSLDYTRKINAISEKILNISFFEELVSYKPFEVVMTGHQPIIYHHGILYKNYLLAKFASENSVTAINVIIDSDEGNAGKLVLPIYEKDLKSEKLIPSRININLNNTQNSYFQQKLPKIENIRQEKLESSKSLNYYRALEGQSLCDSHTIVRRIYENENFGQASSHYLEVPLSELITIEGIKDFILNLIKDANNFTETYNRTLDSFRLENKIQNKANPFPNLKSEADIIELPFWLISYNKGDRQTLSLNKKDNFIFIDGNKYDINELIKKYKIVPKASLITIILRLLCSDIFIHGLGGAKYDKFTDLFIKEYFKVLAPDFLTASADKYYFDKEIIEYEKNKNTYEERRRMLFHIEDYIEKIDLPSEKKEKLILLSKAKKENIEAIKLAKSERLSAAVFTQEIKRIEKEIKEIIDNSFSSGVVFEEPAKSYLDTIYSRDFSYFVFDS